MSIAEEMLNEEMDRKRNHIALLNAEVRRLEAENQNLTEAVWDANRQIEQLREANAELLEALKLYQRAGVGNSTDFEIQREARDLSDAAIQKHGGQACSV